MLTADELIRLFKHALDERWGYIWDGRGQIWTQAMQDKATRDMTVRYGQKWVGRRVVDCSGLFVWAYDKMGADIYHGSNTIFNDYTSKTGALFGEVEILPGTAVFQVEDGRRTHIGLYIGGGKVIEARGTRSGVITSELEAWDEWGTLKDVDYSEVQPELVTLDTIKTLRQGDSGLSVKWLQESLMLAGYDVGSKGADGVYGKATKAAVEEFQRAEGLKADGIAGKKTFAALTALDEEPEEVPEIDEPEETLTMEQKVEQLWEWMQSARGGDAIG